MHQSPVHEILHLVKSIDDFLHFEFHYSGDALHNPPTYLLVVDLSRLLIQLVDLLAHRQQHLQVLTHALQHDFGVGQQKHIDSVDCILHDWLVENSWNQFANGREHFVNDASEFGVFKQLGAILHNDRDGVDWNAYNVLVVLVQLFVISEAVHFEVLSQEPKEFWPDVETAS